LDYFHFIHFNDARAIEVILFKDIC
jgi:hypothetical protein